MKPPDRTLDADLQARAQTRLDALCAAHGIRRPELRFDLTGRAAGMAYWPSNLIRINMALFRANADDFLANVIPHEAAHIWVFQLGWRVQAHGPEWRALVRRLGGKPTRTHQYDLEVAEVRRQRRWLYRCACREHQLTTVRHNRAQRQGTRYTCLRCHKPLAYVGPAAPA